MKKFKIVLACLAMAVGTFLSGCQTPGTGAVTGGALGAVTGGVATGKLEGAAVGGAIGAVGGAIVGQENRRRARGY